MRVVFVIALLLVFSHKKIYPQAVEQEKVGADFLNKVLNNQYVDAWEMLSEKYTGEVAYDNFIKICEQLRSISGEEKEVRFFMNMAANNLDGKSVLLKVYMPKNEPQENLPGLLIEIGFDSPNSNLISVFQWKTRIETETSDEVASPAPMTGEIDLLASHTTWKIRKEKWIIQEVALIHFLDNQIMLAIKVEYDYESISQEEASQLAIPIIEKALDLGWRNKARKIARKEELTLIHNIGVEFVRPKEVSGYQIQLPPWKFND